MQRAFLPLLLLLGSCTIGGNHAILPPGSGFPNPDAGMGNSDGGMHGDGDQHGDGDGDGDKPPHDGGMQPNKDGSVHPDKDGGHTSDAGGDGDDPADTAPPPITPCGGDAGACVAPANCTAEDNDGHTYFFCTDKLEWRDARAACQAAHTDLLIIEAQAENDYVKGKITADSWIGLNDITTEGTMVWIVPGHASVDGAAPAFTSFDGTFGHDNCTFGINLGEQDCEVIGSDGQWDDQGCAQMGAEACAPGLGMGEDNGGHRMYVCESF
jgi:hypothetical protein